MAGERICQDRLVSPLPAVCERCLKALVKRMLPLSLQPLAARVEASSIASRLARGTFWSLVGTVLARGLSVLASIVVARQLGKEGFGELGIIQSTVLNLSV